MDDALSRKLLKQVDIADEQQLEQEIHLLQERITKTRQKMAATTSENAPEVQNRNSYANELYDHVSF